MSPFPFTYSREQLLTEPLRVPSTPLGVGLGLWQGGPCLWSHGGPSLAVREDNTQVRKSIGYDQNSNKCYQQTQNGMLERGCWLLPSFKSSHNYQPICSALPSRYTQNTLHSPLTTSTAVSLIQVTPPLPGCLQYLPLLPSYSLCPPFPTAVWWSLWKYKIIQQHVK